MLITNQKIKYIVIIFLMLYNTDYLVYSADFPEGKVTNKPKNYLVYCAKNSKSPLCSNVKTLDIEINESYRKTSKQVYTLLTSLHIYKKDADLYGVKDKWVSHINKVLNNKVFYGDCEDYAITCAELLYTIVGDTHDIRIATAWVRGKTYHMACLYKNFVITNGVNNIFYWYDMPYVWHKSMRMNNPGVWKIAEEVLINELKRSRKN